ncbi:MAG: flippase-like domain-containing protein [marine benthic group bacterium]|nr:flippase-like domain-containing protein [Gemmatimonadota bacterium]MCL7961733.1 flippase-like domain-containing protein [Candidatus Carthagonibacter metallireducens]MCL7964400.1 flippase-like domain-containing protein [Gemmatimonadota bacterium]MCL7969384.1 flippase-like domain-containing protein [Gemmatimonadota bacterium]MCL7979976.1 flippase-like domain-containing protein [Gemmatimonadota bacterium]
MRGGENSDPGRALPVHEKRKRAIGWTFVALSLVFALFLLVRQGGEVSGLRSDLRDFGWTLRPGWLIAALVIGTANLFLMGAIWVGLFRALGGRIGTSEGVRVWMVTNLGRYIPGKLWQLSGLAFYMRDRRRAGASALTAAGLFQVLVLGTGVAVAAAVLGAEFLAGGATVPIAVILLLLVVLLVRPSLTGRLTGALAKRFGETPPAQPPGAGSAVLAALGLIVAWMVNGLGLWCVWRGAGGGTEPGFLTMAGVFSASYVAGYLVLIAPGGLVVREGTMAGLLAAVAGVPLSVGAAVAVLARLWAVATELLAAGLAGTVRQERGEG